MMPANVWSLHGDEGGATSCQGVVAANHQTHFKGRFHLRSEARMILPEMPEKQSTSIANAGKACRNNLHRRQLKRISIHG